MPSDNDDVDGAGTIGIAGRPQSCFCVLVQVLLSAVCNLRHSRYRSVVRLPVRYYWGRIIDTSTAIEWCRCTRYAVCVNSTAAYWCNWRSSRAVGWQVFWRVRTVLAVFIGPQRRLRWCRRIAARTAISSTIIIPLFDVKSVQIKWQ